MFKRKKEAPIRETCALCPEPAPYRAIKSHDALSQYIFLCLDHIKEHNRKWNYYESMTPEEIEVELQLDTTWRRPSWPFGHGPMPFLKGRVEDHLGIFDEDPPRHVLKLAPEIEQALKILQLHLPLSLVDLKKKYKTLAKACHPDLNPGHEEAFKQLVNAYVLLLHFLKGTS